jgi:transcriptional regulator, araC family
MEGGCPMNRDVTFLIVLIKYNSIVKFKNAIKILRNEPFDNLLSVAVKAGYYDASHLSREIKKLSGSTPNFFLSLPPDNETTIIYTK